MIDESSSFLEAFYAQRQGFEKFRRISTARELDGDDIRVDHWGFSSEPIPHHFDVRPSELTALTHRGQSTALNWCLVDAIQRRLNAGLEMESAVVAVLITDGENNIHVGGGGTRYGKDGRPFSSCVDQYSDAAIGEQIKLLQDSGQWTFVGCMPKGARPLGAMRHFGEILTFDNTPEDTARMWKVLNDRIGDYLDARQGGKLPDHLL